MNPHQGPVLKHVPCLPQACRALLAAARPVGFLRCEEFLPDPKPIKDRNINRLIGATEKDVTAKAPKVDIAERLIKSIRSTAVVQKHMTTWQQNPDALKRCDIIFGCIDGFQQRRMLEVQARRYLIPYIDIGMDVYPAQGGEPPRMVGQIILSMPGESCMRCLNFPNEAALASDAENYGSAGINPQVVWPNGILTSTAVGIAVDLLTGWTKRPKECVYFSYDGNAMIVAPHPKFERRNLTCKHFPLDEVGNPKFKKL